MEIFTLAYDTDYGTGATVHMTEREAHLHLIQENVSEENREEALKQLDRDGEDGFDFWEWFDDNEREPMDTFSIESHEIDVPYPLFDASDLATTLAALRLFQREYEDCDSVAIAEAWPEHFTIEGEGEERTVTPQPLGTEDIDALCERINLGPTQPKLRVVVRVEGGIAEVTECPSSVELIIEDRDGQDEETDEVCPHCGEKGVAYGAGCNMVDHDEPDVLTCEDYDPDTARTKSEQSSLPPDPEGTTDSRASWAEAAIIAFQRETGTDREDALADLLGDLHHWADRNGQDFDAQLDRAQQHYAEETQAEPIEKRNCSTCRWNGLGGQPCVNCGLVAFTNWASKEGETITLNPSSVARMADKLGVIL